MQSAAALGIAILILAAPASAQPVPQRCPPPCSAFTASGSAPVDCPPHECQTAVVARQPIGGWTVTATPGADAHAATVQIHGRTLSYRCRRGQPGLVEVTGVDNSVVLGVDGSRLDVAFTAEGQVHHAQADPGSNLLEALLEGHQAQITSGQITTSFPLVGSGTAIRRAMVACGMTPPS
nr:hypothetical protein [Paracoccus saliphilus]